MELAASPVLSQGKTGPHTIQGIGAGFMPKALNPAVCDEVLPVKGKDAMAMRRLPVCRQGISSRATPCTARQAAKRAKNAGKQMVTLLPDTGERYLSTALFTE